jgi:LacI family transcriptional regulator
MLLNVESAPSSEENALTLEEIAKIAGVSRSTVSRVINNHPNVKADVRTHVWRVVQEQNFHPNTAAQALVNRRTQIVGLVIPQAIKAIFSDPYFPVLIQGISAACVERHYHLMLSLITSQMTDAYRRIIRGGHLDGVIVASAFTHDDGFINRLINDNFPFVLIGRQPQHRDITSVDSDNVHGAMMAVQHLVRQGYTRIASITGPLTMTAGIDRREGFLSAMRGAGFAPEERYIVEGDFSEQGGFNAMQRLLALDERPQALFVASDMMAIGALRAIRAAGLRVPEDIALVGFDDIPLASAVEPTLTTIRQPIEQLGHTAASLLLDRLNDGDGHASTQRIVLPTDLVLRESCGFGMRYRTARA